MSVRVTQSMVASRQLADVQRATSQLADATRTASTQKRITQASDDPTGTARALGMRDALQAMDGHEAAASAAGGMLDAADTALQGMSDVLGRVRELTVRAASAGTDASGRASIATELQGLTSTLKDLANASYDGRYVLAGAASGTRPYDPAGGDAYAGDAGVVAQQVGPGTSVVANPVTGGALLGSGAGDGKLLDVLRTIAAHVGAGDVASLGSSDLRALSGADDALGAAVAAVGAGQQRTSAAQARIGDSRTATTKALKGVEDADLASSLVALTSQQSAYQAALKATGSLLSKSLMDFL